MNARPDFDEVLESRFPLLCAQRVYYVMALSVTSVCLSVQLSICLSVCLKTHWFPHDNSKEFTAINFIPGI